jgi:hypothetical protein
MEKPLKMCPPHSYQNLVCSVGSLKYHLNKAKLNSEEQANFSVPYSIIIVPNILK